MTGRWLARTCASTVAVAAMVLIAPRPRAAARSDLQVSILAYHRFGPLVQDAMTVRTSTFRMQLEYLLQHGYHVVPLQALVCYLTGGSTTPPPPRSVVITGTGLFDIQSHTFWHPNFNVEKRRLSPDGYRTFVTSQFERSRAVLKQRLGVDATILAWPFGISNDELIGLARQAGYVAGMTLDRRLVTMRDQPMALPRFLVTDGATGRSFAAMLPQGP